MICPSCFQETLHNGVCTSCGFDESVPLSPLLLPPGTPLMNGQYLVGKILGKPGGFGITYLGWDSQLATFVAIKEYLPRDLAGRHFDHLTVSAHTSADTESFRYGLEQFLLEARTLAQFDHPNVVRVRAFFQENATAYLVMDYLQGTSLAEHLIQCGGRMTETAALNTMRPILAGLAEVHAKGFLHRDIKPQNIYITTSGRPILLDFGTARQSMGNRGMTTVMTPGYAPWEQYHRHGKQGPWTDIYACAATIYHLVTGNTPPEAAERVAQDDLLPPALVVPGLTAQFSAAIMQALAIDPALRPQTVAEFQTSLSGTTVVAQPYPQAKVVPPTPPPLTQAPPPPPVYPQAPPPQQASPDSRWMSQGAAPADRQNAPSAPEQPFPQAPPPVPPATPVGFPQQPAPSGGRGRKLLIVAGVLAVLLLAGVAASYNSMNGYQTLNYKGGVYEGNVSWNSPAGKGKLTYANGAVYTGDFAAGVRDGKGSLKAPNGDVYEGSWKNDQFDGAGKLTLKNGATYEGVFTQGKRNGNGVQTYADGSKYNGAWQNDKRNGKGTLAQKDGTQYTGAFKDDLFHGEGKLKAANGDEYTGNFDNGHMSGQGTLVFKDGSVYTGAFANDKRNGQGTLKRPSGSTYTGGWKDNKRHGQGTQSLMSNGAIIGDYVGEYRDDIPYSPNGQYKVVLKDGRVVYATYRDKLFYLP